MLCCVVPWFHRFIQGGPLALAFFGLPSKTRNGPFWSPLLGSSKWAFFRGLCKCTETTQKTGCTLGPPPKSSFFCSLLYSAVHLHVLCVCLLLWHTQLPILLALWQDQHVRVGQPPDTHLLGLVACAVRAPQPAPHFVLLDVYTFPDCAAGLWASSGVEYLVILAWIPLYSASIRSGKESDLQYVVDELVNFLGCQESHGEDVLLDLGDTIRGNQTSESQFLVGVNCSDSSNQM